MNSKIFQNQPENPVFVNLLTDAGFKAVYADPANKPLLINLLNTVLPDDVRVSDIVEYRDREQTPDTIYSKKTVLDLVCKDVEGNIFGIEVQKKVDSRLFSRCVFYAAGQYHSQLLAGGDYASLHPVFEIAFLAENYPHENPGHWDADHIVSHYTFAEKRTGEIPKFLLSWRKLDASTKLRRNASPRGTGYSIGSGTPMSSRKSRHGWMTLSLRLS